MKSKKFVSILILVLMLSLAACTASIQESWDKLAPDEKSRIVLNGMQKELNNLFDTGKNFVILHPQHEMTWKTKIVPAFSTANKTLASVILTSQLEEKTPDEVYKIMQPLMDSITELLISIGALK